MRMLVIGIGIGVAALATVASAEPSVKCFEGTETATIGKLERTFRAVSRRTMDPAASEMRQESWTQKDPSRSKTLVEKVDPKTNTFTIEDSELGVRGSGTLVGKPWAWTGYTFKVSAKGFDFVVQGELADDTMHSTATMSKTGKPVGTVRVTAAVFDCAKLDERRAALSKP